MKTNNLPSRFAVHIETVNQDSQLVINWFNENLGCQWHDMSGYATCIDLSKQMVAFWTSKENLKEHNLKTIFTVSQFLELIREEPKYIPLKERTFAVKAKKLDSISHKWFNLRASGNYLWMKDYLYLWNLDYNILNHVHPNSIQTFKSNFGQYPIYTESEFEALILKEKYATETPSEMFEELNKLSESESENELLEKFDELKPTTEIVKCVPYQICPLCGGYGSVTFNPANNTINDTCPTCQGKRVIPMHIIN